MENESHKDDKVVEEVKIVHNTETTFVQDDIQNVPKIRCNI